MDHQVYKAREQAHQRPTKALLVRASERKAKRNSRKKERSETLQAIFERMFPKYRARKFTRDANGAFGGPRRSGVKIVRRMVRRSGSFFRK